MRLSQSESDGIVLTLTPFLKSWRGSLYLFGSRTDLKKRGGDIDLLITISPEFLNEAKNLKTTLIDKIHQAIGEQRVDLTIREVTNFIQDPFLDSIRTELIHLAGR